MNAPKDVTVTMPQHPGATEGTVLGVWHAVDGVRVQVRFYARTAPVLPIGRAGECVFVREGVQGSVTALGKVAMRSDVGRDRTYHFLFGEKTRQGLAHLLEPRRTPRVHPDEDEPVMVTMVLPGDGEKAIIAPARDVSTTGLGVDVPWENETRLAQLDSVHLRVRLPGYTEEFDFEGIVRNRALGRGAISYGFEFPKAADAFDPRFTAISSYVDARDPGEEGGLKRSA